MQPAAARATSLIGLRKAGIRRGMGRAVALLALLGGCSVDVEIGQECPYKHPACGTAMTAVEVASPEVLEDVAPVATTPLRVTIENNRTATSLLLLNCHQTCAELQAVASGGTPPYTFAWEDGSSKAARKVCPASTTRYAVTASDTRNAGASVNDAPLVASAELRAVVPSCERPSSTPAPPPAPPPVQMPTAMRTCVTVAEQRVEASDLVARGCATTIWSLISRPVLAGKRFEFQATGPGWREGRWRMELWGSADGCMLAEKLGEFAIAQGPVDTHLFVMSKHDHEMLALNAVEEVDSERRTPTLDYMMCSETAGLMP